MAYNLVDRFPPPPKYFPFYDPGTYQFEKSKLKPNAVAFLSKTPRKTNPGSVLWTQTAYNADIPKNIPNITSFKSTVKRFPYEALSAKDLEEILCNCGLENTCICTDQVKEPAEEVCQGKIKRRIFKGSAPLHLDSERRTKLKRTVESPPFYNTRVNETTSFYQGCKWSNRTSKRSQKIAEESVGPADYHLEREPTKEEICLEQLRAYKRKTCQQLRFIEKVQLCNILEGKPGPATYSPKSPKCFGLQNIGPKAERFLTSQYSVHPGPGSHRLRRDFELPDPPKKLCQATLPEPAGFGTKANRFKPLIEQGPSPATYYPNNKLCQFMKCPTAAFASSSVRFKADIIEESSDDDVDITETNPDPISLCPQPTWEFKSKTIRMRPVVKEFNESSPPDVAQSKYNIKKCLKSEYHAPFNSTQERFQPWHGYIMVHGKLKTPGPSYYNTEIPKPLPAFNHGPMFRAERFTRNKFNTPAPNEYEVSDGIETILKTHNTRLLKNIKDKHKFIWKPPPQPVYLTVEQREQLLFNRCIAILETDEEGLKHKSEKQPPSSKIKRNNKQRIDQNPKMLRTFLYSHPVLNYF